MITNKKGNLLTAFKNKEVASIAHCINSYNKWGSGIALQLKSAYPNAHKMDCTTGICGDRRKLGKFLISEETDGILFSIHGQHNYGAGTVQVDYGALAEGLEGVRDYMVSNDVPSIGLPRIGAGLAGGDWTRIFEIIEKTFANTIIDVTVFEYGKNK